MLRFFRPRGTPWLGLYSDPERGSTDSSSALRCLLLVLVSAILTSCGSSPAPPDGPLLSSSSPTSVARDIVDGTDTTTKTAANNSSTTETATSTPLTSFDRVYLAPDGADGQRGDTPDNARQSVQAALEVLNPGGVIVFGPGTYPPLRLVGLSGSVETPIRIEGSEDVEFRGEGYRADAGVLIRDSQHIEIAGMRVRFVLWGVYIENAHHITVRGLDISDIGQEGIRIKGGSTNVRIDSNVVADTGRRTDNGRANGEGIYVGTGSPGGVDLVDQVVIINNRVMRTTDEAIDIKRPATNIDIIGNVISDVVTNTSGAIVIHLNGDRDDDPNINIERNVIRDVTRSSSFRDGNCIVSQVGIRIVNNVLHNCQHRGIFLRGSGGTATVMHNTLLNTGDVGAIVSEGRGMQVVNKNNLGAGGSENRAAGSELFVAPNSGDYRLTDAAASDLSSAPNVGVMDDLFSAVRPAGTVTFGAVEALPVAPSVPTTTQEPSNAPRTTQPPVQPNVAQGSDTVPATTVAAGP